MDKKLPKVFANKINKNLDNNKSVFYSNKEDIEAVDNSIRSSNKVVNINQKINYIFSSPKYVYKADVDITTNEGVVSKRVVGKNRTHLITIDNELIPISNIIDINFIE